MRAALTQPSRKARGRRARTAPRSETAAAHISAASGILQGDRGADPCLGSGSVTGHSPCFTTGDATVPPAAMSRASFECGHGIHLDTLLLSLLTAHGWRRVEEDVPLSPRERGDQ